MKLKLNEWYVRYSTYNFKFTFLFEAKYPWDLLQYLVLFFSNTHSLALVDEIKMKIFSVANGRLKVWFSTLIKISSSCNLVTLWKMHLGVMPRREAKSQIRRIKSDHFREKLKGCQEASNPERITKQISNRKKTFGLEFDVPYGL